ncbi:hypothetical protein BD309DRAFT_872910 [Dichomitus squalens]|uniref:DUF6534 domain-containing protein n=1 Tax=Dichomitus squalens TaxID=114155 RepID=A0A4Q9NIV6_9APHY|nr:hypothetical protein BD309DRAFT_872910 [Dichomitus squalens]TBU52326.1 hypothetical protein BD310DRAFT_832478 [Dichomitus squalens]
MATASHELTATILAMSDRAAFPLPALDNTYGALLLGTFIGLMLYGLTVHQTYRYFRLYPTDILILVYLVIYPTSYYHLVSNYFNPIALLKGHWYIITSTSGLSIFVCQAFYARRVWYAFDVDFIVILPDNFIWAAIGIVAAKLYANSVLPVLNSRRALSDRMLEGIEMGSYEPRGARARPHTVVDTWDVPQLSVGLPSRDTYVSFTTPTDIHSDEAASGVCALEAIQAKSVPCSEALIVKMAA